MEVTKYAHKMSHLVVHDCEKQKSNRVKINTSLGQTEIA